MATKPYGLILAVGPTGSGKTTTLHSTLGHINTKDKKIWTAEDPVEITQKGLRQVQMLPKIGLDFARAMRSFLRGDPDVIMVGEMRDVETCFYRFGSLADGSPRIQHPAYQLRAGNNHPPSGYGYESTQLCRCFIADYCPETGPYPVQGMQRGLPSLSKGI